MKTTTLPSTNSVNRSPLRRGILLIPLLLACFALSRQARAACQEGCDLANRDTFLGEDALLNSIGYGNTAIGFEALTSNTSSGNTATGADALQYNTTGGDNTATGAYALYVNTTGDENTTMGRSAMQSNTTGSGNTATGFGALFANTTGFDNTVTGRNALSYNTTGDENTTMGRSAMQSNTTGSGNTATGYNALLSNSTGGFNIALGESAGINLTTGSHNIDIGNAGVADESGIIRIGTAGTQTATFIAGIREAPLAHGVAVAVGITPDGQLGVRASSARFKEAIKPMGKASEAIFSLKPVIFRYKKELDPKATPQFGLVAEEVAKVDPDLVALDEAGKPFTVRYDEVNAMLLNEFLKEHRKVEEQAQINQEQEAKIAGQQKEIAALTASLKEQAAQIQKVSDQLKTQAPAPRVVAND